MNGLGGFFGFLVAFSCASALATPSDIAPSGRTEPGAPAQSALDKPIAEALKEHPLSRAIDQKLKSSAARSKHAPKGQLCEVYIDDKGQLGPAGKTAVDALKSEPDFQALLRPPTGTDIAKLCPNYDRMNDEQRSTFWVWTLAGVEWTETFCGDNVPDRRIKPNRFFGRGKLPTDKKIRRQLSPLCENATTSDKDQVTCALALIRRQLVKYENGQLVGNSHAYYVGLRKNSMASFIRSFPLCGN